MGILTEEETSSIVSSSSTEDQDPNEDEEETSAWLHGSGKHRGASSFNFIASLTKLESKDRGDDGDTTRCSVRIESRNI